MLPQGLRYDVALAGSFWRVFPERCLGGSGGAFRMFLLWVSSGESPTVGPVLSRAVGAVHRMLVHECFSFMPSGALVASGACDSIV
ncbi:hypothetical protein Taro_044641, partial [Colocasia esculenta]|nr:hypothetical protein [Colocasia esculenta]